MDGAVIRSVNVVAGQWIWHLLLQGGNGRISTVYGSTVLVERKNVADDLPT